MSNKILIVGDDHQRESLTKILKLKGEIIMEDKIVEDDKKVEMKYKAPTIKDLLQDWGKAIIAKGQTPIWPSWAYGTLIRPEIKLEGLTGQSLRRAIHKNALSAANQAHMKLKGERKTPDQGKRLANRHGKLVKVAFNRAEEREQDYFKEDNALEAITAMMKMPRDFRRTLARKLNLKWAEYIEAEEMILEG